MSTCCLVLGFGIVGCTVEDNLPLGDLVADGQAGALPGDGGTAGSAGTASGGQSGSPNATGGTSAGTDATGGVGSGGAVGQAGAPGAGGAVGQAGAPSAGAGAPGGDCFSPFNVRPSKEGAPGCSCDEQAEPEDGICVVDLADDRHSYALYCRQGRWSSVEDGPCEPRAEAGCQVTARGLTQIVWAESIAPSPYSACNSCTCGEDGELIDCSTNECAIPECPAGTIAGSRCVECGPVDNCSVVETGCLPACEDDDQCPATAPRCIDGICRSTCPP